MSTESESAVREALIALIMEPGITDDERQGRLFTILNPGLVVSCSTYDVFFGCEWFSNRF